MRPGLVWLISVKCLFLIALCVYQSKIYGLSCPCVFSLPLHEGYTFPFQGLSSRGIKCFQKRISSRHSWFFFPWVSIFRHSGLAWTLLNYTNQHQVLGDSLATFKAVQDKNTLCWIGPFWVTLLRVRVIFMAMGRICRACLH